MFKKIGILLGSSLLMSSLLAAHPSAMLEPLQTVQFFDQHLLIKVHSNGCTKPSDFVIETQQNNDAVQLSIHRKQADFCRAMPRIVEITLPFSATENTHYYIANPWIFSKAKHLPQSVTPSNVPTPSPVNKTSIGG